MIRSRVGAVTIAFLLAGIFLILLFFAIAAMSSQVKASNEVVQQLNKANNNLAAVGLQPQELPNKPASLGFKTKSYNDNNIRFDYPSNFMTKKTSPDSYELASDSELFGRQTVAADQVLCRFKTGVNLNLATIESYLDQAPYAQSHSVSVGHGSQILRITNRYLESEWPQALIARSPHGPYDFISCLSTSGLSKSIFENLVSSFQVIGS